MKGTPSAFFRYRQILEEDLLLQVLGPGRDEHALAAEDSGDEIGQSLARARARFGQEHASLREDVGHSRSHLELGRPRFEAVEQGFERAVGREDRSDARLQAGPVRPG